MNRLRKAISILILVAMTATCTEPVYAYSVSSTVTGQTLSDTEGTGPAEVSPDVSEDIDDSVGVPEDIIIDETVDTSDTVSDMIIPDEAEISEAYIDSLGDSHRHCVCCSDTSCGTAHDAEQIWTEWPVDGAETALPVTAGYYYLTEDVTLTENLEPADGVHLCINGKTVHMNGYRYNGAGNLTITNCKGKNTGGFEWKDSSNYYSRYVRVLLSAPDLKLYDTSFTVSNLTGGDVYVAGYYGNWGSSSTLYIDNCIIKREDTDTNSNDCTFLVYSAYPTTATIMNSSISCEGENSDYIYGVFVDTTSGKLTIENTEVEINSASTEVCALYVTDNKTESNTPTETVSVSESSIAVNTTATSRDAYDYNTAVSVCSDGYSTFSFTDCIISATTEGPAQVRGLYLDVAANDSYRAYCTAELDECIVTASSTGYAHGIDAEGPLNMTGGSVTASGAESNCTGLYLNPKRSDSVYSIAGTEITGVNRGIDVTGNSWPVINLKNANVTAVAESGSYGLYSNSGSVYLGGTTMLTGTQGGLYKTAYSNYSNKDYNRPAIYAYSQDETPLSIASGKTISVYYAYQYAATGDPIITGGMTTGLVGKLTTCYPENTSIDKDGKLVTPTKSSVIIPYGTGGSGGAYSNPERTIGLPSGKAFEGQTVYIKAVAENHYVFSKWEVTSGGVTLDDATAAETFFVMGNKNVDLNPVFVEQENYAIQYKGGSQSDGTVKDFSGKKYKGEACTLATKVFKNKTATKVQTGWSKTDGGAKAYDLGADYETDEALTLYPCWQESVKVTFNYGDFPTEGHQADSVVSGTPLYKTPGQRFYLSQEYEELFGYEYVQDGAYVYYGWKDSDGHVYKLRGLSAEGDSTSENYKKDYVFGNDPSGQDRCYYTGDSDITLYPYMVRSYSIRYAPDDNTANPEAEAPDQIKDPGSDNKVKLYGSVNSTSHVKTGVYTSIDEWKQQGGWATEEGGDKVYELGQEYSIDADVTLYPYWETIYKVTYAPGQNGINPEGDREIYHKKYEGISINLYNAIFVRPGYIQSGWNTEENGSGIHFDLYGNYALNADNTLYPEWQETKKITYMPDDKCDDGIQPVYQTKYPSVVTPFLSDIFTAEGYKLIGWNTQKDQTEAQYDFDDEYNTDENLTVYPVWQALTYSLWVGNIRVTSANIDDVLGDGGSVSFDPDTFTLTLNNADITSFYKMQTKTGYAGIGIYAEYESEEADVQVDRLKIKLVGENTIDSGFTDCNQGVGIFANYTDSLEIFGSGSLTIGNSDSSSCKMTHAIQTRKFILKDAMLTLYAHSVDIYASSYDGDYPFVVESGTLNASAWDDGSPAVYAVSYESAAVMIKGGTVNLTTRGGMGQNEGQDVPPAAIFVSVEDGDAIEISGGEVTLTNQGTAGVGILEDCSYTNQEMGGYKYFGIRYYAGTTTINAKTAVAAIYADDAEGVEFAPVWLGEGVAAVGGEDGDHAETMTDPELLGTCKYAKLEGGAAPDRVYLHLGETTITDNNLSGEGWAYDPSTQTLTLDDYDLSNAYVVRHGDDEYFWEDTYGIYAENDLNILLSGTSSVGIDTVIPEYGIYSDGTVTVSGEGYLNVFGEREGIFARAWYISDGGCVEAGASTNYAVYSGYGVQLNSGRTIIESECTGIYTEGDLVIRGGELDVTSGEDAVCCYAYNQTGGDVRLVSSEDGNDDALAISKNMTVSGGSLYAEAYKTCIYNTGSNMTMTVSGGHVLAKPRSGIGSTVQYSYTKVTGGFLEIIGGYRGIYGKTNGVSVTGGSLLIDVTADDEDGSNRAVYGKVAVNRQGLGYATSPGKPLAIRYDTYNLDCNTYYYNYIRVAGVSAISYEPGTGIAGESFGQVKETGKSIELQDALFTNDGFVQDGWSLSDGGDKVYELGATYSRDADLILYPHWAEVAYTVTYKPGENSNETDEYETPVATDGKVTFRDVTYTRDDYVQKGWSTDDNSGTVEYGLASKGTITADLILYPVFSNAITVTYDRGSKGKGDNVTVDATINMDITLEDTIFTRAGYKQTGWSLTDGGDKEYDLKQRTSFAADTTLYPVWARDYKLNYIPGSAPASGDVIAIYEDAARYTEDIEAGQEVILAEALFEHVPADGAEQYVQVGWSKQSNYTGQDYYSFGSTVKFDSSVTLYPVWMTDGFRVEFENYAECIRVDGSSQPVYVMNYTGKAIKPAIKVYDGSVLLTAKKDYTFVWKNNTNANMTAAGLAEAGKQVTDADSGLTAAQLKKLPYVELTGKGNYSNKQKIYFSIAPASIKDYSATDNYVFKYAVKKKKTVVNKPIPAVTGSLSGKTRKLKNTKEFTVKYYRAYLSGNDYVPDDDGTYVTSGEALPGISTVGKYVIVIEGKGNFKDRITVKAELTNQTPISKAKVTYKKSITVPYDYANTAVTQTGLVVKMGSKKLTQGTHYTVTYKDNQTLGTAIMTITGTGALGGNGGYYGSRSYTFKIAGYNLAKMKQEKFKSSFAYDTYKAAGYTQDEFRLYRMNGKAKVYLEEGTDYTVEYKNNLLPGTATVTYTGKGVYAQSSLKKTYKINGIPVSKLTYNNLGKNPSFVYNGTPRTFETSDVQEAGKLYLTYKASKNAAAVNVPFVTEEQLAAGVDGVCVRYVTDVNKKGNNTVAGTTTVQFIGSGKYSGILSKKVKITPYDLNTDPDNRITVSVEDQAEYLKGGARPEPIVSFMNAAGEEIILDSKSVKISYKNNTAVNDGTNARKRPTIVIEGRNNFKGKRAKEYFEIVAKSANDVNVVAADKAYANKANNYTTSVSVYDTNGKALKAGTDYDKTFTYKYGTDVTVKNAGKDYERSSGDAVVAGDIVPALEGGTRMLVTVKGKGNYDESKEVEYFIRKTDISKAKVIFGKKYYYDKGNPVIPAKEDIVLKLNPGKKTEVVIDPSEYEIVEGSFTGNTRKGTSSFTIRGINNSAGTIKVKFTILSRLLSWLL